MLFAKLIISLFGLTSLYFPAISVNALKVILFPVTAAVTPNFPLQASLAAYPPNLDDNNLS